MMIWPCELQSFRPFTARSGAEALVGAAIDGRHHVFCAAAPFHRVEEPALAAVFVAHHFLDPAHITLFKRESEFFASRAVTFSATTYRVASRQPLRYGRRTRVLRALCIRTQLMLVFLLGSVPKMRSMLLSAKTVTAQSDHGACRARGLPHRPALSLLTHARGPFSSSPHACRRPALVLLAHTAYLL